MERAVEAAFKRDDDAMLTVLVNEKDQVRAVYLETSEGALIAPHEPWLVRLERQFSACGTYLLDADLLYNEMRRPLPDVHTRVVRHVHLSNLFFVGLALVLGLGFYYWPIPRLALILLISFAATFFAGLYLALIMYRTTVGYGWWEGACVALTFCAAIIVGCAAALSQSVAPFELMATFWVQSVMVLLYTQWAPRNATHVPTLGLLMGSATLCVWALGIVAAFELHGWRSAIVVLVLSLVGLMYQMAWLRVSITTQYTVSWRDSVLVLTEFYGAPIILLHHVIMTQAN
jgi:hypothetical protein